MMLIQLSGKVMTISTVSMLMMPIGNFSMAVGLLKQVLLSSTKQKLSSSRILMEMDLLVLLLQILVKLNFLYQARQKLDKP